MGALIGYRTFVKELRELWLDPAPDPTAIDAAIGMDAYGALRSSVALDARRAYGIFFSGGSICAWVARSAKKDIAGGAVVLDPACGAGDLLLACARSMPLLDTLPETLRAWSTRLHGKDVHPELVEATKYRLALLARRRGRFDAAPDVDPSIVLSGIAVGDGLGPDVGVEGDLIVLNPPFSQIDATGLVEWASGRTSLAPIFLDRWIDRMQPGCRMLAILPEVIRCGSRYRSVWETTNARMASISVEEHGQFDPWTDIDVFLMDGRRAQKEASITAVPDQPANNEMRIGDAFEVRVGPVIDYRDPHQGPEVCYLRARDLPSWTVIRQHDDRRQFRGRLFEGTFVVVRRTSRPGDRHRMVATIVDLEGPVAVENHLIVMRPLHGGLAECQRLMARLRSREVSEWLDRRMRCRHLTVGSVRDIPLGVWESQGIAAAA